MKRNTYAFFAAISVVIMSSAAVPIHWQVETSRLQPVAFDALHGETLELAASFQSYGKPLAVTGPAALYYQTNGMGAAWWQIPATVASNRIEAVFPPSADPGAARLNCFLGGTASTYRAAFSLRFATSPGAIPNTLPLPVAKLDLAAVEVMNAPWITAESDPTVPDWAKLPNAPATMTTNAVKDIVTDLEPVEFSEWTVTGWPSDATYKATPYYNGWWWEIAFLIEGDDVPWLSTADTDDPNATHLNFDYGISASRTVLKFRNKLGLAMADDIPDVAPLNREIAKKADASAVNALSNTVTQWTTYWDGDDVRVTITNYYGSMALPSMYLEQRMPADETHDNFWFKVVWNEMTRWNDFLSGYASVTNELAQKADRAWGFYDSSTGEYSPDGFLQISTPNIILAKDMAYQKTVTTGGCAVWVLTATQPVALTGETEQGYFRITDGDGNSLFEIVKGDKRIAGATATALTMDGGSIVIPYSVTGDNPQPTLSVCTDLAAEDWQTGDDITVAAVSWAVSDGHWTATVTPMGPRPSLFFKASYEAGGNTYIKNNVATSIDKVVIGGHEYTVTVETVNGKKLLVLQ